MKKLFFLLVMLLLSFSISACIETQEDLPIDETPITEPTDPADPVDPVDPADPVDPVDPEDPTDPVDPEDPTDPVDPVDPEDPTDPVDPVDPEDPTDPVDPTDPEEPVIAPDPVVVLEYDFGTSARVSYAAGAIYQNEDGTWANLITTNSAWNSEINKINKDRVQINISTFEIRAQLGAFLVFAPIQNSEYSYFEIDLTELKGPATIEFEHITWHSTNGPINIATLTLAEFRLELYNENEEKWEVVDFIDLKEMVNGIDLVKTIFNAPEAGIYRIVYYIEGATSTSNTQYAMIIDNLIVTE